MRPPTMANLWEMVELADLSVRAASDLRKYLRGVPMTDPDALRGVSDFMQRAERGSAFLTGRSASESQFDGTLRPLNWALAAYLRLRPVRIDYDMVSTFLGRSGTTLVEIAQGRPVTRELAEEALEYVQSIGEVVGSMVDSSLRQRRHVELTSG